MLRSSVLFQAVALPYEMLTRHPVWERDCARMALEDGLALVQIQLRDLSENAKLFGGLVRQMRRSICPATLSLKEDA